MLYYTSLMFISLIFHGYYHSDTGTVILFSLLTPCSCLNHLMYETHHPHYRYINVVDKSLAHVSVLVPFVLSVMYDKDIFVIVSCLYVGIVYRLNQRYKYDSLLVHATIHLMGTLGYHRWLAIKND